MLIIALNILAVNVLLQEFLVFGTEGIFRQFVEFLLLLHLKSSCLFVLSYVLMYLLLNQLSKIIDVVTVDSLCQIVVLFQGLSILFRMLEDLLLQLLCFFTICG